MVQCVHPAADSLNDHLDKLDQSDEIKCKDPLYIPHTITNHCIHTAAAQCMSVTG